MLFMCLRIHTDEKVTGWFDREEKGWGLCTRGVEINTLRSPPPRTHEQTLGRKQKPMVTVVGWYGGLFYAFNYAFTILLQLLLLLLLHYIYINYYPYTFHLISSSYLNDFLTLPPSFPFPVFLLPRFTSCQSFHHEIATP